ncbi:MAG: 5'-methylthioadenosine nucleosidase [Rhodothermales bacterium]
MIGLLFSTAEEGRDFFKSYERGRFEGLQEGDIEEDGDLTVGILGSGKVKATLRCERFLRDQRIDHLVHAGLCSALKPDVPAGTLVAVDRVFEGDRIELTAPSYPPMPLILLDEGLASGTLVTQDHPIQNDEEQSYWQRVADYVDSSGYALAYVAATYGVPLSIVKAVSGSATGRTRDVRQTRAKACEAIGGYLIENLLQNLLGS